MTKEAKLFFWIAVVFMVIAVITESRLLKFMSESKIEHKILNEYINSWVDYIHYSQRYGN